MLTKQKIGNFKIEKALQYGIKPSSIYQSLKTGKIFCNFDGTTYNGTYFCNLPSKGSKFINLNGCTQLRLTIEIVKNIDSENTKMYRISLFKYFFNEYNTSLYN